MIIGLTGKNAVGKGEVAQHLKSKGFDYFSLSDEIREVLKSKNIIPTRENLIKQGNELREKESPSVLAKMVLKRIKGNAIVDSIRNPSEIIELRKQKDFILLGIDAPIDMRFSRTLNRNRVGDAKTLKEYGEIEEKENFKNRTGQQLNNCLEMADEVIMNDNSLGDLFQRVDKVLKARFKDGYKQ